jgi:hypothetical protein
MVPHARRCCVSNRQLKREQSEVFAIPYFHTISMESGSLLLHSDYSQWHHLLAHECKQIIVDEWKRLVELKRISIYAFVVMPKSLSYHLVNRGRI